MIPENRRKQILDALSTSGGIDARSGVTNRTQLDISVKKAVIQNAEKTVLLMDHTKVGLSCYYKLCDLSEIDFLVTDESVPEDLFEQCNENLVRIVM